MLTTQELANITNRISYKPGWDLFIKTYNPLEGPYLFIHTWQPDADLQTTSEVELRIASPIPPVYTTSMYIDWVMWRLKQVELHELMEWFRVDNEIYIDPHAPK